MLEPHDHVAWYGDGDADLYALAATVLDAGATHNDKLLFVSEDPDPGELGDVRDLDRLLASGQLELHAVDEVYPAGGAFSAPDQLATFEAVLGDALAQGYRGIRVVADNTALVSGDEDEFRRWLEWEQVTDRFQAASAVTGVCFFDRRRLSEERQVDLAAVHPFRSAGSMRPRFSLFVAGDAVSFTGTLDAFSEDQLSRLLGTAPNDGPLVVDLSRAEYVDHRALLALDSIAQTGRSVHVRGAVSTLRRIASLLGIERANLHFEAPAAETAQCADAL